MDWRTSLGAAANQHFQSALDQLFATLQRCDPHGDQQANGNLCTQTAQSLWAKAKSLDDFQKKVQLKCNKIQGAAAPSPSVVPSAAPAPATPQPFVQQQYAATPQQQQVQVQQHLVPHQQMSQQQLVQQQQQFAGPQTGAVGNRYGAVMPQQQQQQQPQQAFYAGQQQQQHAQVNAVYSQQKHQQPVQAAQPNLQVPYVPPPTQQRGGVPAFGDNSLYAPRAPAAVTTQGYAMASQATVPNGYSHSGGWPQQQVQVPAPQSAATASYNHQGAAMKRKHDVMSAAPSPYVQHQPQQHASVTRAPQQQQAPAFVQQQQQQQAVYNMNHVNGSGGVVLPQQAGPSPDRREPKRPRSDGSGLAATGGIYNGGAGAIPAPQMQPPQAQVSSTPADVNAQAGQEVRQPTRKDLFMQNQELFVWLLKNHKLIPDDQGGRRTDGTTKKSLALTFVQGIMRREKLDSPVNDATLKLYSRVVKEVDQWRKGFGAHPTPVAGAAAVPTVPPAPHMQQPPPQQSFTQHSVATTSSTVPPQPLPHMPAHAQTGPAVQQMRQAPIVVKHEPKHAYQQQQQPPPPLPQQQPREQRTAGPPPPTIQQQPLPPPPQPLPPMPPPIKKEPSMPMPLSLSVSRLETSELDLDSLDDLAGPVGFVAPAPVQTLPEAAVGHVSRWDAPLNDLRDILADSKKPFVLNPPPDRPGQPKTKEQERQEARRAVVNRATQALSNLPALMQSMMDRTGLPMDSQGDLGAGPLISRVRAAFNGALAAMTRSPEQGQQNNEPAGLAAALSMFKRADDLLHELKRSVVPEAAREGGKARHHPERRRHIVEGVLRGTLGDEIDRVEQLQSSWVMRVATSDGDVRSVGDLIEALRGLKQLRDFELSAQGLNTLAAAYGKGVWCAEVLLESPSGGTSLRAVHVEVVVNGAPQSAWSEKMGDVARTALLGWRRVCKGDVVRTMAGLLDELRDKVELGRCEMTGRALKLDMLTMELSPPFVAPPSSVPGSHGLAFPLEYRGHRKLS